VARRRFIELILIQRRGSRRVAGIPSTTHRLGGGSRRGSAVMRAIAAIPAARRASRRRCATLRGPGAG